MIANQSLERVATPIERSNLPAKLISSPLALVLFLAACVDLQPHLCNLRLQPLQPLRDRFKGKLDLTTLHAKRLKLLPCNVRLALEPLRLLLQPGESCRRLGLFVAGLRGALHQLQSLPAVLLGLLLRSLQRANRLLRVVLLLVVPPAASLLPPIVAFSRKLRCCSSSRRQRTQLLACLATTHPRRLRAVA